MPSKVIVTSQNNSNCSIEESMEVSPVSSKSGPQITVEMVSISIGDTDAKSSKS